MNPLAGIRILDLSRLLPGPYATQLLADLGAEVIKIETPLLGDYARQAPPEFGGDTMFHMINRGKKSLSVNYRNKQGREIFLRMAEGADVILETFKPGSVDKWGIGYQAVRERNPAIIYCAISGYGQSGPYRDRPGHDINYIAVGGLLGLTGEPKGLPVPPAIQTADLGGATFAAMNILAAILERSKTGTGRYLDVAMIDPIVHWVLPTVGAQYFGSSKEPARGRLPLTGGWPSNRVYKTADSRYLALGALEPPFWSEFCRVVDRPDLLPKAFEEAAIPEVVEIFSQKSLQGWMKAFDGVDIPLEPVHTINGMLTDPQVQARGLLEQPGEEEQSPRLNSPFPYPSAEGAAPELGRDTQALLLEAGYSEDDIQQWSQKRIIKLA